MLEYFGDRDCPYSTFTALDQKNKLTYDCLIVLPLRIKLIGAEFEILDIAEFHLAYRTRNSRWLFHLLSKHHHTFVANKKVKDPVL